MNSSQSSPNGTSKWMVIWLSSALLIPAGTLRMMQSFAPSNEQVAGLLFAAVVAILAVSVQFASQVSGRVGSAIFGATIALVLVSLFAGCTIR